MSQSADGVENFLACDWFPDAKWLDRRCLHFMPGTRGTSESVSGQPHAAETRSHSDELLQWVLQRAIQRAGWDASGVAAGLLLTESSGSVGLVRAGLTTQHHAIFMFASPTATGAIRIPHISPACAPEQRIRSFCHCCIKLIS